MSFWLAPALVKLRAELDEAYPKRDRTSDGWIGDRYHAGRASDHNPANHPGDWSGVVRAYDVDNDVAKGVTGQTLADLLAPQLGVHPALGAGAYLIYNHRIISTDKKTAGWRRYTGQNPHTGHIHISVGRAAAAYNSKAPWGITEGDPFMGYSETKIEQMVANGVAKGLEGKQITNRLVKVVWSVATVRRNGKQIPVIQELADANTRLIALEEKVDRLVAALEQGASK